MTNDQLTKEFIKLTGELARMEADKENMLTMIEEVKEDVRTTKALTEDVHIMAVNMESMQKTIQETNNKVEELTKKDYNNYNKTKGEIKSSVIGTLVGSIVTGIIVVVVFLIKLAMKGGAI